MFSYKCPKGPCSLDERLQAGRAAGDHQLVGEAAAADARGAGAVPRESHKNLGVDSVYMHKYMIIYIYMYIYIYIT